MLTLIDGNLPRAGVGHTARVGVDPEARFSDGYRLCYIAGNIELVSQYSVLSDLWNINQSIKNS